DYVDSTYGYLLQLSEVRGVSSEMISSLIKTKVECKLQKKDYTSFCEKLTKFLDSRMKADFKSLSVQALMDLIRYFSGRDRDVKYERQVIDAFIANAQIQSVGPVLQVSRVLYLGATVVKPSLIDYRAEILHFFVKKFKKEIVTHSIEIIKATTITSEFEYKIIKPDIEIVTQYGGKEGLAQI